MEQDFCRMTDKAREPIEEEMLSFIGEQAKEAWLEIRQFLEDPMIWYLKRYFMEQSTDGRFVTARVARLYARFSLK